PSLSLNRQNDKHNCTKVLLLLTKLQTLFYNNQMIYLPYHSDNGWGRVKLNSLVNLFQSQSLHSPLLLLAAVYHALDLCYFDFCHDPYPLKTLFKSTPLCKATVCASRIFNNASTVAFTTLCGFEDPRDLANTSVTPALSSTARIAPPASTPVPLTAGFINTLPPENLPYCS